MAAAVPASSANAADPARAAAAPVVNRTPATILASRLSLSGLGYDGIVDVQTALDEVKAMKFTLRGLRLDNVTVSVPTAETALRITGRFGQVRTGSGERSTIYLRQLKGKLKLGPIPIPVDFTPENPPPLTFPWLVFDDVTIGLYLLDGGDLTVPDATMSAGGRHVWLPAPTNTPAPPTGEPGDSEPERNAKPARSNPYSPEQVCGDGYRVIDSRGLGDAARAYLLRNSGNRHHCVVTSKRDSLGSPTAASAFLEVRGRQRMVDSGEFSYYAGPVRAAASGHCVRWGGSASGRSYTSQFEHCS